ncbi:MAG TPA: hypothetical protein VFA33_21125 [Bryobacteraceae bacterium]|nr:hypothetical protein [Bryobacteraceae bacterium]
MPKVLRSHKIYVPLITILGSAFLFCLYYLFYVSGQRAYADERAFRLLSAVSDQLQQRLEKLDDLMAAAYVSRDPRLYLQNYLRERVSDIETNPPFDKSDPGARQRNGRTRMMLAGSGGFALKLEYRGPGKGGSSDAGFCSSAAPPSVCAGVAFDADVQKRVHSVTQEYFDAFLVATSRGDVLFQKSASGLRVADMNAFFSPAPQAEKPKAGVDLPVPKDSGPAAAFADISQFSNVVDVQLAGTRYKLYVQPMAAEIPGVKGENVKPVICGLWRADRFQSEVVSIPYSILIWTGLLLLSAFALGWPVLKLAYMSPAERLRRRQVFHLLFSSLVVTALLSLIVLNWSDQLQTNEKGGEQLQLLADTLDRNLKAELVRAVAFLNFLGNDERVLREGFRRSNTPDWMQARFLDAYAAGFADLRGKRPAAYYPYFDICFWADSEGRQQFKITVEGVATPAISVQKEDFFQAVLHPRDLPSITGQYFGGPKDLSVPGWEQVADTHFYLTSRYSPNTGEFFAILAVPYSTPAGWTEIPPNTRNLKAVVLVSRFLSLLDPVVPPGYGYAVLDHRGIVQFHSNSAHNKIEDFFRECRQNSSVMALAAQGQQDFVTASYMGRQQHMLVRPMPYLGEPSYTLVVFRDSNYFRTVNVACILVFSLLAGLLAAPFLAAAALFVFRSREYPLAPVWPARSEAPKYVNLLIANACLIAAFAWRLPRLRMDQTLLAVLFIVSAAAVFAALKPEWAGGRRALPARAAVLGVLVWVAQWSPALLIAGFYAALSVPAVSAGLEEAGRRLPLRRLYVAMTFSLLAVLAALPCFGLFKIAHDTTHRLALEAAQIARRDQLQHRAEDLRVRFRGIVADAGDRAEAYASARLAEGLDRYDKPVFDPEPALRPGPLQNPDLGRLEPMIAGIAAWLPANGLGAAMREAALGHRGRFRPVWATAQSGDMQLLWLKETPGSPLDESLLGVYPRWRLLGTPFLLLLGLAAVLVFWLAYVTRKVFVTELEELPPLETWQPSRDYPGHLLILGNPKSGKSAWAAALPHARMLDLAQMAAARQWTAEPFAEPLAIVDHFEFDLDNPEVCLAKLRLLEQLLYVERKRVVLLSAVDPIFYLVSSSPEILTVPGEKQESPARLLDRWSAVFSQFHKLQLADETAGLLRVMLKENQHESWRRRLARMVLRECDYTAQLRHLGASLLEAQLCHGPISRAEFLEELLERADPYYRVLWATCTRTERLVLYQLAEDGWANPKNQRAIQQLQRRGLIRRECGLRIMNESFRRFVQAAQCPHEVARWEEEEAHSTWSAVKLALGTALVAFAAWLLYTQRDVFQVGVGYIAALGAATTAVTSLVRGLTGRGAGQAGG